MFFKFFLCMSLFSSSLLADRSHYRPGNFTHAEDWTGLYEVPSSQNALALNLKLDSSFAEDAREILKEAMSLFMERALKSEVLSCAFANASYGTSKNLEEFRKELTGALTYRKLGDLVYPGYAYIVRLWNDPLHLALAYIKHFYKSEDPLPGYGDRHYFYIAVNSDFIGYASPFVFARDVNYWAGILAHEFLHNLGYSHPTGISGSFIGEYERCIASDGLGTSQDSAVDAFEWY